MVRKIYNIFVFYSFEIVHFIIFFVIPIYILYIVANSYIDKWLNEHIVKTNQEITKILPASHRWDNLLSDSIVFKFASIYNKSYKHSKPTKYIYKSLLKLSKRFPNTFKWAIFISNKFIPEYSLVPKSWYKQLNELPKIILLYRQNRSSDVSIYQKTIIRDLLSILNSDLQFKKEKHHKYLAGSFSNKNTKIYISSYSPKHPWFICWISFTNKTSQIIQVLELETTAELISASEYKVINLKSNTEKIASSLNLQLPEFIRLFSTLNQNIHGITFYKGFIWKQYIISRDNNFRWLIKVPVPFYKNYLQYKKLLNLFIALALFILFIIWIKQFSFIIRSSTRIYIKIIFIYVTLFPIIILLVSIPEIVNNIKNNEETKLFTKQILALQEVDRQFTNYVTKILDDLKIKLINVIKQKNLDHKSVFNVLNDFFNNNQILLIELFDSSGKSLFYRISNKKEVEHLKPLLSLISKICGQKIYEKNILLQSNKKQSIFDIGKTVALKAILESLNIEYNKLFSTIDSALIVPISIQSGKNIVRLIPIFEGKLIKFAVLVYISNKEFSNQYLHYLYSSANQIIKYPIFDSYVNATQIKVANLNISPKLPDNKIIYQAVHKSIKSNIEYLVSIIMGKNLSKISVGCLTDNKEIKSTIFKYFYTLSFIVLCITVTSVFISNIVNNLIFKPFKYLESGLKEVSSHNFRVKLPVEGSYEFVKLLKSFNDIVESLSDLEIGRVVQDTFFPKSELTYNNWQLYGRVVNASRVGGDYIDYYETSDGKWLIIIGDVAGHGVSAALVVAMIKAIVNVEGTTSEPIKLLETLNKVISINLQRKKFMTCCISLFDPKTGDIELVNGAHFEPYLISKKQEIKQIVCRGFPLGFGFGTLRHKWDSVKIKLEVGDTIIFYTDGLVEARLRKELVIKYNSDVVGFELFESNIVSLISEKSAKETEENIRNWHYSVVTADEMLDDISILVLQSIKL